MRLVGRIYRFSDRKLEVLEGDTLRVVRFLGVAMDDVIPDHATIAGYPSQVEEDTARELFDTLRARLAALRYAAEDA